MSCLRHIGLSREHPQFSKSLQIEHKSTSKAHPLRAIPEQTPRPKGITLWSHLQSNIPDFTQKSPVTTVEVSVCNHVASALPRWRRVTLIHSRRTVMDNDKIPYIHPNHHASNRDRYNKSAHKNHVVTHISSAPHQHEVKEFSKKIDILLQWERDFWTFHLILTQRNTNAYLKFL